MSGLRISALLWLSCLQFFVAEQIVRHHWALPYSFATNYVSDLGAVHCSGLVCSPWHALMNASFILQGLLIGGGGLFAWSRRSLLGPIGLSLVLLCGAGVIIVGFVPEDTNSTLHRVGAAIHFLAGGLALLAIGFRVRKIFGLFSVVAGAAVIAATLAVAQGSPWLAETIGTGTLERIAAYGIAGWMIIAGAWFYRRINASRDSHAA